MRGFAKMRNLDVWYAHMDLTEEFVRVSRTAPSKVARKAQKNLDKARTRDSMQAMQKFTEVVDGRRRIISAPPLIMPLDDLAEKWGVPAMSCRTRCARFFGATAEPFRPIVAICSPSSNISTWR